MGYKREHFLAWSAGTNVKDFSQGVKVVTNSFTDGFVIPVPKGAFAVTVYVDIPTANDTTVLGVKLLDSPDKNIWSPAQVRTNETAAAPIVSYDMLDTVYKIKSVVDGIQKAFQWRITMSEFIKLQLEGDGAAPADVKAIFVFGVQD